MKSKLLVFSQGQSESYQAYFKRLQDKVDSMNLQLILMPVQVGTIIHTYIQWVEGNQNEWTSEDASRMKNDSAF